MKVAQVILYLFVTIVVCPIIIIPVIIGCTVGAGSSGLFAVVRDRLLKRVAALRTKPARTAEEPGRGRVRTAEEPVHGRIT